MNVVLLIASLASDVEVRGLDGGRKRAGFLLAVDRPGSDGQAGFFRVAAWNTQAEMGDRFLARGQPVAVDGRLHGRSWEESDGRRPAAAEGVATAVDFPSRRELKAVGTEPVESAAA